MCSQCLLLFLHLKANGYFKPSTILQGQCPCSLPKWPVTTAGRVAFPCTGVVTCLQPGVLCSMAISGWTPRVHPHNPVSSWQRTVEQCPQQRRPTWPQMSAVLSSLTPARDSLGHTALRCKQHVPHICGSNQQVLCSAGKGLGQILQGFSMYHIPGIPHSFTCLLIYAAAFTVIISYFFFDDF